MPVSIDPAHDMRAPGEPQRERRVVPAVLRGLRLRCPACGIGRMFRSYLKVVDQCPHCGEDLSHQRADDAPAYVTIVIVGHIVVAGILAIEKRFSPETWVQLAIWLPMTVILSLALLPAVKGGLVALQWALRMHGFGKGKDPADPEPDPAAELARASGGSGR